MNTKQILAENTKRLRNLSKPSQFDFADEINMSKTVLSDIENARANPTLETIERLAAAFHTTPARGKLYPERTGYFAASGARTPHACPSSF